MGKELDMFINVKPFDTLFFRNGRPFYAGEDTWVESIFPPYPSTFYGALRSFLIFSGGGLDEFKKGDHKYKDMIGYRSNGRVEYGSLKLNSVYVSQSDVLYVQAPHDLLKVKGKEGEELCLLSKKRRPDVFISNYPFEECLINTNNQKTEETNSLTDLDALTEYLTLSKTRFDFVDPRNVFNFEDKIGIKRDKTKLSSQEGYLYRLPLISLRKDTSFVLDVDGANLDDFPSSGVLKLGGEGKAAKFEVLPPSEDPLKNLKEIKYSFKNEYFKVCLLSPAIFSHGFLPSWIDDKTFEGEYKGIRLKLVSCSLGKPVYVGGWDLDAQKPKPTRKAVPAGSVYYFKLLGSADISQLKMAFHLNNISDDFEDTKYSKEGYGLAVLGEVE